MTVGGFFLAVHACSVHAAACMQRANVPDCVLLLRAACGGR